MEQFFIAILSLFGAVFLLVYLCTTLWRYSDKRRSNEYDREFRKFVENMEKLDIEERTISKMLGRYLDLDDLKSANKKLQDAVNKFNI